MTFEDFAQLLRQVLNQPRLAVTPEMSAAQVPGWDSLNHAVIMMEVEAETGVEILAEEAAALPNIGSLIALIQSRRR